MKGDHGPTNFLHALTWGAFDHASHASQVRACNYLYVYIVKLAAEFPLKYTTELMHKDTSYINQDTLKTK